MSFRFLTALPVYNEIDYVDDVLHAVSRYSDNILVIDDGSTDGTSQRVNRHPDVKVVRHEQNQGYGAALKTAFEYAMANRYEVVVTIDCDGQHEPIRIPQFVAACQSADIVSGSRYLQKFEGDTEPPYDRMRVNKQVLVELKRRLKLDLTDAFCGFKAYRVDALTRLEISENGYAMPLELWVQAVQHGLRIMELPVPLIYLDESRSFGGVLEEAAARLQYYHLVLDRSILAARDGGVGILVGSACQQERESTA
jgi:dolichol-phosphate mannosyltransferase